MTGRGLLAGRAAVVTGGSRGIGRAVVELLCNLGANVVVNGRDDAAVSETVAAVTASGGRATAVAGAADDETVAAALVNTCRDTFGRLDILINCAGIAEPPGSSILDITPDEFNGLISAHVGTVFHTCRVAAPAMVEQGHGTIINTSSVAFLGDYGGTGYPAGKGAVNGLTVAIAAELKAKGIRANVVCPGARTRLSTGAEYEKHIADLHGRGLLDDVTMQASLDSAPPSFVAPLYAYLASDLARDVTGQILVAAGGFVGRFDRPTPSLLGYRDHHDAQPWSIEHLHKMIGARS
ncbi:SDR family NAD(P)-dependent oxidoreductase [Mycobacterium montefiorense]|uniref:Short chain dehydrogenase/reductase n=1 Tax=Mycobacterium montefiorense TaxID=154654 RepID=A0AA37UTG4_9MYCO|nr:SDR family NAD(P)-dependent oxidoreductase [Mycobacterium montefiorense]GBG38815.1 putative short chain dehydrogenase/reductase [Mycobacterium montefiorense]GKU34643.1 putative short chain dehydrogenase/reductase [Mycobacterium montefiorense]GKU38124.1 putative short chain dehydrogenase/reductase [Mycobacterium montefiorense]GKU43412.1 putative short chain dehydrogenase/reductase [Mycobacterium montefiorense]GKU50028.1 putative short chain dehydrogenase/reductase [Mycobacterium montefiorens